MIGSGLNKQKSWRINKATKNSHVQNTIESTKISRVWLTLSSPLSQSQPSGDAQKYTRDNDHTTRIKTDALESTVFGLYEAGKWWPCHCAK